MMSASLKLKNVGFIGDTVSAGKLFADELPTFGNGEYVVFPGFCDVHVHFREPGFSYKETMVTGSKAAARGGYTDVCTMPNLKPVPDSADNLRKQLALAKNACIHVYPYGAITVGQQEQELADLEAMAPDAIAFSDDGRGVQTDELMRQAMLRAKALDKMIVAHCEVNSLLNGGYIHDGAYAKTHGHKGICSESEYAQIARDLKLVEETGCRYHVCHVSAKESVALIRQAKKKGLDVTCETAPHYLLFSSKDVKDDGRYRMNPPIREEADRLALLEGISDGTVDMIATDHAPHSAEEKSKGLKSLNGIVGLECAFPVLYTELVRKGEISLEKLIDLFSNNPAKRFGIDRNGFCVYDLENEYIIDVKDFASMGKCTPFEDKKVFGKCVATVYDGKLAYVDEKVI